MQTCWCGLGLNITMELNFVHHMSAINRNSKNRNHFFPLTQSGIIQFSKPQPKLCQKAGKYGDRVPVKDLIMTISSYEDQLSDGISK